MLLEEGAEEIFFSNAGRDARVQMKGEGRKIKAKMGALIKGAPRFLWLWIFFQANAIIAILIYKYRQRSSGTMYI